MNKKELGRLGKKLKVKFPLIGHSIRMSAIKKIAANDTPDSVLILTGAISSFDPEVARIALQTLKSLENKRSVDTFCKIWFETREQILADILVETGYIAGNPAEVRVASALKSGNIQVCDSNIYIEFLVKFLQDKDKTISQYAAKALKSLSSPVSVELLCDGIIKGNLDAARQIAIEMNYQPAQLSKRCSFLVITGQIEKYLALDFEFQQLRAEYQAAPIDIQNRIRNAILLSNDNRLVGLFGEVRKKFVAKDLNETEAELMINIYARDNLMDSVFALMFFIPLRSVIKALDVLAKSFWRPETEDQRELLSQIQNIRQKFEQFLPIPDSEFSTGSVINRWINIGISEKHLSTQEETLRMHFNSGTPSEAIAAMSSLAENALFTESDHQQAKSHPHWLVRLAYILFFNRLHDNFLNPLPVSSEGGEYWLGKIIPVIIKERLLQIRAVNIDPDSLRLINKAITSAGNQSTELRNWALLLSHLAGFTLRNIIAIGTYEKRIEDTAIVI